MTETTGHERRGADGGQEDEARVSLYPLDFEDALRGLLAVEPDEPEKATEDVR